MRVYAAITDQDLSALCFTYGGRPIDGRQTSVEAGLVDDAVIHVDDSEDSVDDDEAVDVIELDLDDV